MTTKTITRPSFEEIPAVIIPGRIKLRDVGLEFSYPAVEAVGIMDFYDSRKADYGRGFRMVTMPELVQLVYGSFEHEYHESADNVIETLGKNLVTGNTGVLYTLNGMYVQDNPRFRNKRISMTEKTLEKKLGSHQEGEVVFSDDRKVRFAPYVFEEGYKTPLELSRDPGVIAIVGGEENTEKIAEVSRHYRGKPYLWTLEKYLKEKEYLLPKIVVAGLRSFDTQSSLGIYADYSSSNVSFGVREIQ